MALLQLARAGSDRAGVALLLARIVLTFALSAAATLAAAAPAVLFPSVFNDGTPVDGAVLGTRIPVLLVHGLGGSDDGWNSFLRAYEQDPSWRAAFKPYSFRYSSTTAEVNADPTAPRTISALGGALRDAMQRYYDKPTGAPDFGFGNKRVVVLAHSMGGLVARSMMQEYAFRDGQRGGQKVLHLITLGTAHQGTQLADLGIVLGVQTVSELSDTYAGFLRDLTWTNFDGLDLSYGRCNPWLARLNNYAPSGGANYGRCGLVPGNPLPGYYERIIAYGASALQKQDTDTGAIGVYKPGSSSSLLVPYTYLRSGLARPYANDGVVPMASAQFNGAPLWLRSEAFACDHRYIRNAYPEFVRTATSTYTDFAFCAAASGDPGYPSGIPGGYAVSGSIFGVPGGIVQTIKYLSQVERVFNWFEAAYAAFLQPAGASSDIIGEFYYRYYGASQAYMGVRNGDVYYLGPASNNQLWLLGPLSYFLGQAQGAGF